MNKIRKAVVDLYGEWPMNNSKFHASFIGVCLKSFEEGSFEFEEGNFYQLDIGFDEGYFLMICTREQFDEEVKKWKEEKLKYQMGILTYRDGKMIPTNGRLGDIPIEELDNVELIIKETKMELKHQQFSGTLGEFAERYINGDTFYSLDSGHAYALPDNIKAVDLKGYYQSGVFQLIEPVWYENLGDGVLCWVWDRDQTPRTICLVTGYSNAQSRPYETYMDDFIYAQPLTKEEAMRFVWGEA